MLCIHQYSGNRPNRSFRPEKYGFLGNGVHMHLKYCCPIGWRSHDQLLNLNYCSPVLCRCCSDSYSVLWHVCGGLWPNGRCQAHPCGHILQCETLGLEVWAGWRACRWWGWGWGWRSSLRMKQSIGKGLLGKSRFQFCGQGSICIVRAMSWVWSCVGGWCWYGWTESTEKDMMHKEVHRIEEWVTHKMLIQARLLNWGNDGLVHWYVCWEQSVC